MSDLSTVDNPYVGLRPFQTEDADLFFGRDRQIDDVLALLKANRFVGVVGSSGSGKSSLLRAGVMPAIVGGFMVHASDAWRLATIRPGDTPLRNLAAGLLRLTGRANEGMPVPELDALEADLRERGLAAMRAAVVPHPDARRLHLHLLVDQFEEIFAFRDAEQQGPDGPVELRTAVFQTVTDESGAAGGSDAKAPGMLAVTPAAVVGELDPLQRERLARHAERQAEAAQFVQLMLELSRMPEVDSYVTLTMRTDFLGDCDIFIGLPEALNKSRYLVPRMTRAELLEAIEVPARAYGAEVAPRLADAMANALGDRYDRLPLLQHALMCTWEEWRRTGAKGPLDLSHFRAIGGLDGALDQDANRILHGGGVDREEARLLFRALVDTDANRRRVRRPCRLTELETLTGLSLDTLRGLITRFAERGRSYLYISGEGPRARVDLAHESLIRQWRQLRDWVDEERELRDRYRELVRDARAHLADQKALLTEVDLAQAVEWREKTTRLEAWSTRYSDQSDDLTVALQYLEASERDDRAWRELERRRARNRQFVLVGFALLMMLAAVGGWAAWSKSQQARVVSQFGAARGLLSQDPTAAVALLAELDVPDKQADVQLYQDALNANFAEVTHAITDDRGEQWAYQLAVDFSADGLLAAAALGRTIDVFGRDSLATVQLRFRVPEGSVQEVHLNRTRDHLIAVSDSGSAFLWDLRTLRQVPLPVPFRVTVARFSHHGSRIVIAGALGELAILALDGTLLANSSLPDSAFIHHVQFSHDDQLLVAGTIDGIVLWRAESLRLPKRLQDATREALFVEFSADDRLLGVIWSDSSASVLPVGALTKAATSRLEGTRVTGLAWGMRSDRLATVSDDGIARVFSVSTSGAATGVSTRTDLQVKGHRDALSSLAFTRGDSILAIGSYDGSVTIWNTRASMPPEVIKGSQYGVHRVLFDDAGKRLLTYAIDGTTRIGRAPGPFEPKASGLQIQSLIPHRALESLHDAVSQMQFNATGDWLGIVTSTGRASLWSLRDPGTLVSLGTAGDSIRTLTFNRDGTRLLTTNAYGEAQLWNRKGERIRTLSASAVILATFADREGELTTLDTAGVFTHWVNLGQHRVESTSANWDAKKDRVGFSKSGDHMMRCRPDQTLTVYSTGIRPIAVQQLPIGCDQLDTLMPWKLDGSGRWLATFGKDSTLRLWSRTDSTKSSRSLQLTKSLSDFAVSSDGAYIAVESDNSLRLWRTDRDTSYALQKEATVAEWTFSDDGKRLLASVSDGSVRLWDVNRPSTGVVLMRDVPGARIAFGPSPHIVAIATPRGDVTVLDLRPAELRKALARATNYCLDADVRVSALGESPSEAARSANACRQRQQPTRTLEAVKR